MTQIVFSCDRAGIVKIASLPRGGQGKFVSVKFRPFHALALLI
ncbi:hypothetical protein [Castellaniella daejeonensis]|jgi:hypothetical protein